MHDCLHRQGLLTTVGKSELEGLVAVKLAATLSVSPRSKTSDALQIHSWCICVCAQAPVSAQGPAQRWRS